MRQLCLLPVLIALATPPAVALADNQQDAYKLGVEATQCMAKKEYAQALKLAEQAIRLDPKHPYYHGLAGSLHWFLQQYEPGLEECKTAIDLAGGKGDAWYLHMAGENANGAQDFPLARKLFEQAISRGEKELGGNFAIAKQRLAKLTEKRLEFEWALQPEKATFFQRADGSFLIPLPSSTHPFQTVNKMNIIGDASHETVDFEGNEALVVKPKGKAPIRIQFSVTMTPYSYKAALAKYRKDAELPEEAKKYLGKSEWLDPKSPKLLEIVEPLRRESPLETVEQIIAYLRGRLTYVPGSTFKSAEDVLEKRKAVCWGWSAAFTGLCRAAGIPARMVDVLDTNQSSDTMEFHTYCEFYVAGAGWIPIEPQPPGIVGVPDSGQVRLYHYSLNRKWVGSNANEVHPLCVLKQLGVLTPKYTVVAK